MQPCTSNVRYYLCLSIRYTGRILAIPEILLIGGRGRAPRAGKYTEKTESSPSVDFMICSSILQSGMENLLSHPLSVLSWQPSAPIYYQSSPIAIMNYLCQLVYKKRFILASGFQFGIEWPHGWGLIMRGYILVEMWGRARPLIPEAEGKKGEEVMFPQLPWRLLFHWIPTSLLIWLIAQTSNNQTLGIKS